MALVCFAINACSTVDIKYINRETVKGAAFMEEKPFYHRGDARPTQLGALHLTPKYALKDSPGQLFILQRKRGIYMTETKIGGTGKKRYFLSIGVNPVRMEPAIGFRMEF